MFYKLSVIAVSLFLGMHSYAQEISFQGINNMNKEVKLIQCMQPHEWEAAKNLRQKYFFDKISIVDPYTWTFDHAEHIHFVLYQNINIIGYAHVQRWPQARAALRIIVIDESFRNQGFGGKFLTLCEKWLKKEGYKSLHTESSPQARSFYEKHGYQEMPFNDPDGYQGDPQDIPMGKILLENKKNEIFLADDYFKKPIILEWEEIIGKTEMLDTKIKSISKILIPTYLKQEVEFISKNTKVFTSEDIANDFMIKALAPLLEQGKGKVNLKLLEEKTKNVLDEFFESINWSQYSTSQDVNIFVIAKDQKTKEQLGVIQFLMRPEFPENNVKAALFGIIPSAQNRGLEKILMSSIFRLRPDTQRIFLHTRSTNQQAILDYENWGFTQFKGNLPHWTDLEYLVDQSNILQKIAESFVVQN
jgi:ribosomal protein S18 acetylase RimI-like enzyme